MLLAQVPEAEQLSADPEAPVAEVGWRSALRAKLGVAPNLVDVGSKPRFRLRLPSYFELSNPPRNGSFVPWIFWRARIQLEGLFLFRLSEKAVVGAALRLEHESDHSSSDTAYSGYININSIALLGSLRLEWPQVVVDAALALRLHVLTCTVSATYCVQGGGGWGDRGFEAALGGDVYRELTRGETWVLDAFGSVFASYTAPTFMITFERRLSVRAGLGLASARSNWGRVFVYLSGVFGTPPGFLRASGDAAFFGFGLGWTATPPVETSP